MPSKASASNEPPSSLTVTASPQNRPEGVDTGGVVQAGRAGGPAAAEAGRAKPAAIVDATASNAIPTTIPAVRMTFVSPTRAGSAADEFRRPLFAKGRHPL